MRHRRRCFWITVDGMSVRAQTDGRQLTERDLEALRELARAAAKRADDLEQTNTNSTPGAT